MAEPNRPIDFGYQPWTELFATYSIAEARVEARMRNMVPIVLPKNMQHGQVPLEITKGLMEIDHDTLAPWTILRHEITDDGQEGDTMLLFTNVEDAVLARMFVDG